MPRLIVNAFLTLDGVMQAPGGPDEDHEGGFEHGGWQFPYADDTMGRLIVDGMAEASAFLLGRKTYEIFASHWPRFTDPADPIAAALNSRPKYVASRTLERVTWNNSRLIRGDLVAEVRRLRAEPGSGVHTWGSTDLLQTLLAHDLVDELRTWVHPVILGTGKRLFREGARPAALELVESAISGKGTAYLRYRRAGAPTYGTMS